MTPPLNVNCLLGGADLNVTSLVWGCNNARAIGGVTDNICVKGKAGLVNISMPSCTWKVENLLPFDKALINFDWPSNSLIGPNADLGVAPVLRFQAILSNPPPLSLTVTMASETPGGNINLCAVTFTFTATPQTTGLQDFVAQFGNNCPAGFDPHFASRLVFEVVGPNQNVAASFSLVQTTTPFQGPCIEVASCPAANFTAVKSTGFVGSVTAAGTQVPYTVVITNTGEVPLTTLAIADPVVANMVCSPVATGATLAVAASTTCRGSLTVTQAQINVGASIVNTAQVSFAELARATNTITVPIQRIPSFSIAKIVQPGGAVSLVGAQLQYSMQVVNTGNTDLTGFVFSDPTINATCTVAAGGTLLVQQTAQCSGTYTVTQNDFNTKTQIDNTATASFTGLASKTAGVSTPLTRIVAFDLTKTADLAEAKQAGEIINYTITITNRGNADLSGMSINDPLVTVVCAPIAAGGVLPVSTSTVCRGRFVVQQSNLNSGQAIVNVVTVSFASPAVAPQSANATTLVTGTPALTVSKFADLSVVSAAGQTITYTIPVQNTGNVDLQTLTVTDARLNPSGISCSPVAVSQTLPVGATTVCTGRYTTTQQDILNGGTLVNTVSVSTSRTTAKQATATVNVQQTAMFTVSKTTIVTTVDAAGQVIPYIITVRNTGTLNLTNFAITDALVQGGTGQQVVCTPALGGPLAAGETAICTATYVVTQANVNSGADLVNLVAARFTQIGPQTAQVSTSVLRRPSLVVVKTQDRTEPVTGAQTKITYTISVRNTGNVDLTNYQVLDPVIQNGNNDLSCNPPLGSSIAVSASATCQGSYTVTQADLNTRTIVTNVASVTTTQVPTPVTASVSAQLVGTPALTIVKTANSGKTNTGGNSIVDAAGTRIAYTITVRNAGNVDLSSFALQDPLITGRQNDLSCAPTALGGTLNVGVTTTCTGSYVVTDSDMSAGAPIVNVATATTQRTAALSANATTLIVQSPSFTAEKRADVTSVNAAGNRINYNITVVNTGNVALLALNVVDTRVTSLFCAPVGLNANLPTGQRTVCRGSYDATQADINAGLPLVNTATVSFTNSPVQTPSVSVNVLQNRNFVLTKSVDKLTTRSAGDVLTYSVVVSNVGNTDLINLQLTDELVSLQCNPVSNGGTLAAFTGTTTCRGTYTTTQADVNGGANIVNTVFAALGGVATKSAVATTSVLQNRALAITKTPSRQVVDAAGQSVQYTISVSNAGNVDLTSLSVVDPLLPNLVCLPIGVGGNLRVGTVTVCQGTYIVTQANINAGTPIRNTATASAPLTAAVSATASVNIQQNAMFTAIKTVNLASVNTSGTVLQYTITVTNTGNEDLANLQIADPLTGSSVSCSPVAIGGILTVATRQTVCTTSYTVKQSDINAGLPIVNNATVVTTQAGPLLVQATTTVVRTPSAAIFKQASRTSVSSAGQQIDYVVQISNTGNVDLLNIQVDDALVDASTNNLVCTPVAKGGALLVGGTTTCRGFITTSQANINSGSDIVNVAGVTTSQTSRITASVTTTVSQQPSFTIAKTASVNSVNRASQQVFYTIVVTNDGNVDLRNLQISDARLSTTLTCGPVPQGSTLTVAQRITTCTGSYTTTQQDINNGQPLVNVASAQFTQIASLAQPKTSTATVNIEARPVITLTKVADRSSVNAAGQVVTYTITVTNGGNQDLQNMQLSDSLIPSNSLRCTPVQIGQTLTVATRVTTCTGTYTVQQSDINRGASVLNSVIVQTAQTQPVSAQAVVNIVQSPSFSIAKTVDQLSARTAGQLLVYTIIVRNTGNMDLANFNIQDERIQSIQNDLVCTPVARGQTLPTAQFTTCTGSYIVTQGDVNSGASIVNTAAASFQQAQQLSASVTTTIAQNAAMTLTKRADKSAVSGLGEVITYTIVASNGGNVDLTGLQVSDSRIAGLSCSPVSVGGVLPVAQSTTCTGVYSVSQADINAGAPLLNTATASSTQTRPISALATVNVNQDARFNVTKTASVSSVSAAGEVIQYAIIILNTGNEDLQGLRVLDPLISNSPGNNNLQCSPVAIGQTLTVANPRTTCTGTLTVTQAQIDAGETISNVATVAFTATPAQTALVNTNVVRSPFFTVTKTVDQGSVNAAGQTLRYSIRIENTGNTVLTNMQVSDFLVETGSRDLSCTPVAVGGRLAVRTTTTCTGTFVTRQSTINAGVPIVNTASVQFTEAAVQSSVATTTVTQTPAFTISKIVDRTSVESAGQVLSYSITVQNRGNVDLANFQLSDPLIDGSSNNIRCNPVARGATLTVSAGTTVCTGSYTVRQADINAGQPLTNVASASFANAQPLSAEVSTSVVQRPLLSITKTASPLVMSAVGDVVGFSVVVKNEGNVDLVNLQVRDDLVDSLANNFRCAPVVEGATLPVGASTTCTGTFVATQQTINAGVSVVNTAFASGGNAAEVSASVTVSVVRSPSFTISKAANVERVSAAGGVISWTIQVRNTGNVDLNGFALSDPLIDESSGNVACSPTPKGGVLPVRVVTTCVGTYTVSQSDLNTKTTIVNTATAVFTEAAAASASATVSLVATPALIISKTASPTLVTAAGEVVTYTVIVNNIGNVDLPTLAVTDPRVSNLACSPVTVGSTLTVAIPSTRCTGTYITTQVDIDAGVPLVNVASASSARTAAVTAQASVNIQGVALFDVTKSSDTPTATAAGQRIRYTISITNKGTVDLANLRVSDPLIDQSSRDLTCSPVAIGSTLTVASPNTLCTGSYLVAQADMDRGDSIVNIATVTTARAGPKTAQATTVVAQRPSFTVTKSADLGVVSSSNTTIRYTIVVRNTGNVGLPNLQVADDLLDATRQPLTCQPVPQGTTLLVGGETTCLGGYQVTQTDLNRGTPLVNTATVRTGNAGPLSASASTAIQQNPSLSVVKFGDKTQVSRSGEVIRYELLVTNTGNIDLVNLAVVDQLVDESSNNLVCFPVTRGGTMTVAQPVTRCTGTYTVPQSRINAGGTLVNVASVSSLQTQPVTASFITQIIQNPLVSVTKAADRASVGNEGDVIQYSFVVSNIGNVDLTNFQILDPLIDNSVNDLTCQPNSRTSGVLPHNQTTFCRGTYVVPQSVINVGGIIRNTVSVTSAEGATASAFVTTQVVQTPSLQVTKTADRLTVNTAGQFIRFNIEIRNTGNMDLNNLQVVDQLVDAGANDLVCAPYGRGQTLPTDVGVTTCTGSYAVTQADLNAGGIIQNIVSVSSTQTAAVSAQSNTIVAQNARLVVNKVADPSTVALPGQTITYRISVQNGGNVDVTQLSVVDNRVDSGIVTCSPVSQGQLLAVGATTVCVGSKQVTQAVIDAAVPIVNTAVVSSLQSGPVSAIATVNVAQSAMLTLTKRASVGSVERAGQVITYSIVAENAGTVNLDNFQLTDQLLQNAVTCSPFATGSRLAVAASTTCVGTYTVTQNDMNAGANVVNTASAQTTQAGPVVAMDTTKVLQLPAFTVTKTASPSNVSRAGEVVTFTIAVRNTGNVDLENVRLTDRMIQLGANNLRCSPLAEGSTLTVANPTTTCVGTYIVTQADVNAGVDLVNFVSVNTNQFGPVSARATVTVVPSYVLSVVKRASLSSVSFAGQIITWSLVITNTGSADLSNLRVIDPLIQNNVNDLRCSPVALGSTLSALSPTTTCSGTYRVTQQDMNTLTAIVNTASVTATGLPNAVSASASVTVVQAPSFTVIKQADRTFVDEAGMVILYTLIIRNTGNTDLPNFQISDPLVDGGSANMACRPISKGATLTVAVGLINCTGSATVTQAQMNAGAAIVNMATVSFASQPAVASQSANVSTAVVREPSMTVTKQANRFSATAAGQEIVYEILISNTGNVDLPNLNIVDPFVGNTLTCSPVGQGGTLTVDVPTTQCSARYVTTQQDIDRGANIVNTVTVSSALTLPVTATAVTFLTQTALLSVQKAADKSTVTQVGEVINYSIVVRNVGNVAQTGVSITDTKVPALSCTPSGSALAVGAAITCTGAYTVTSSDINAGVPIVNIVTARSAQATTPVTAQASVSVFSFPQFTASKRANVSSVSAVGSAISYTIDVLNTGTVSLTGLTVTDPLIANLVCSPVQQGGTLPRASSTSCTGTYLVTQQNINAGIPIINRASVTFADVGTVIATATVGVNSVTAFTVSKTSLPSVVTTGAGTTVVYSVLVINTGSSDLTGFQINDPLLPGGLTCSPVTPGQTLARGASTACSAQYTVTAGDMSRGTIVNVVTVTLGGLQRTASAVTTIRTQSQGSLTLVKTASPTFVNAVGQVITYTLTARNTGTTALIGVTISDPAINVLTCLPVSNGQALLPGTFINCSGTVVVTQQQLNSGIIVNTAQVTAVGVTAPVVASAFVVVSATAPTTAPTSSSSGTTSPTTAPATPIIFFTKTSSPVIVSQAGQSISYAIRATNGGLNMLQNVVISDPSLSLLICTPPLGSQLVSGASMTCTGSSVVTSTQIQSGADIINTATVSANGLASITQAKAFVKVATSGTIAVSKTTSAPSYSVVGSRIPYTITILNNLNVNAQSLTVSDPLIDTTTNDLVCSPVPRGATLGVGATTVCTGTFVVTQSILNGGQPIVNQVFVSTPSAPGQTFQSSVSTPKGTQGQLLFQITIINGQIQFVQQRDEMHLDREHHEHQQRETDLSSVQLRIIDSLGAVYFVNLTSQGFFSGQFAPGPAEIYIIPSTLPPGITLVAGSNPTFVTIPANGVIGSQVVFATSTFLSGLVYYDVNGNGVRDANEPGIANVRVTVSSATAGSSDVFTNATGYWTKAVNGGELTSALIDTSSLGLGASVSQTQGSNPSTATVPTGSSLVLGPAGFRLVVTTTQPTTTPPTQPPSGSTQGDTEVNFYFKNILKGACGCNSCPCRR